MIAVEQDHTITPRLLYFIFMLISTTIETFPFEKQVFICRGTALDKAQVECPFRLPGKNDKLWIIRGQKGAHGNGETQDRRR
jgi:hypothetical protein